MKRTIAAILLALSLFVPSIQAAKPTLMDSVTDLEAEVLNPWTEQLQRARICSVGVVSDKDDLVLTAAHCVLNNSGQLWSKFWSDKKSATVVKVDEANDLALLKVKGISKPALEVSKKYLQAGDYVETSGYPMALGKFWFKGSVTADDFVFFDDPQQRRFALFDMTVAGGQSGSPVVDKDGKLVSVVQIGIGDPRGFNPISGGVRLGVLREFLRGWV